MDIALRSRDPARLYDALGMFQSSQRFRIDVRDRAPYNAVQGMVCEGGIE